MVLDSGWYVHVCVCAVTDENDVDYFSAINKLTAYNYSPLYANLVSIFFFILHSNRQTFLSPRKKKQCFPAIFTVWIQLKFKLQIAISMSMQNRNAHLFAPLALPTANIFLIYVKWWKVCDDNREMNNMQSHAMCN